MGQIGTPSKPFAWSHRSERAALLVAEDELTDVQIADEAGISRSTLDRWKHHPDFWARVDVHIADFAARIRRRGLGRLDKRFASYEDRHRRMSELLDARSRLLANEIDGGATGAQVRTLKSVTVRLAPDPDDPDGKTVTVREEVWEYAFDAALMRELRELEKQAAQDAGQFAERREISGPNGGAIPVTTIEVVVDEVIG